MASTTITKHKRRTKKGRVTVKKHTRKIKGGKISADTRQIFNLISNRLPNEYGGYLDFDKSHKLERFEVIPGHSDYVEVDPDFEVTWHTHPVEGYPAPPSPDDIVTLLQSGKQQVELIFNGRITYIVVPTKKAKQLRRFSTAQLRKRFHGIWNRALETSPDYSDVEKKYLKGLRKEGFIITRNTNPHKPLHIPIKIVEPTRGGKR